MGEGWRSTLDTRINYLTLCVIENSLNQEHAVSGCGRLRDVHENQFVGDCRRGDCGVLEMARGLVINIGGAGGESPLRSSWSYTEEWGVRGVQRV